MISYDGNFRIYGSSYYVRDCDLADVLVVQVGDEVVNIYNIITMAMLLLAAVVVNTDGHRRVQAVMAAMVYVLLITLLTLKALGVN